MQSRLFCDESLKTWFLENRRDLPWRENPSPYSVWVSEVMLQQTQASVVQGYFLRWMERFPTITALAAAPLEEVIKLWEGLGYYSRARHLHLAAHYLVRHNQGQLPTSYEELMQIKGLGRYTVGAILSFAFKQKKAAVDGNTIRVLSRYFAITENVCKSSVKEELWRLAEAILPETEPWLVVEGLIELGALVCKKDPACGGCPLKTHCKAYRLGIQKELPKKGKKKTITPLFRAVFVIVHQGSLLVKKGKPGVVMADLYEFPFTEGKEFPIKGEYIKELPTVEHHFTRFKVQLKPTLWKISQRVELENHEWIPYAEIDKLAFSSGHRKILHQLKVEHAHFAH